MNTFEQNVISIFDEITTKKAVLKNLFWGALKSLFIEYNDKAPKIFIDLSDKYLTYRYMTIELNDSENGIGKEIYNKLMFLFGLFNSNSHLPMIFGIEGAHLDNKVCIYLKDGILFKECTGKYFKGKKIETT